MLCVAVLSTRSCYHKSGQSLPVGSNHFIWGECVCVNVLLCVCVRAHSHPPIISTSSVHPFYLKIYIYAHIYGRVCVYILCSIISTFGVGMGSGGGNPSENTFTIVSLKWFVNTFRIFGSFSGNGRRRTRGAKQKIPKKNRIIQNKNLCVCKVSPQDTL